MENKFNWPLLLPYLLIAAGTGIMLYTFLKKSITGSLAQNGKKAAGIIFELEGKSNNLSTSFENVIPDKIIVRFVTDTLDWITAEAKNEFGIYYSGQYKIGDKVEVMYDPENPNQFIILTKQAENKVRLIAIVAGLVLIIAGIFQLFK